MSDDEPGIPAWADRLRRERDAREWSQADAVAALRTFSDVPLPGGLLDQWKRWEQGRSRPDEFYRPLIAATFGTVTESLFPSARRVPSSGTSRQKTPARVPGGTDTRELAQRVRAGAVDTATSDAIAFVVEQLCCDYASRDPGELIGECREWLTNVTHLLEGRLTPGQNRDILDAAGWLALLVGCLEYDTGRVGAAEAARAVALRFGSDAGNMAITGWAHEMRAWFALTGGRLREVITAAQAGQDAAAGRSVSVQLLAQEAKAWARLGSRRNVARALEKARVLLDSLPYPDRVENHFVVDPQKFDFHAMDCCRLSGDNELAEMHAREIIRQSTAPDGTVVSPMRKAESELTLGVVAARRGRLDEALSHGHSALSISRRSQPSLLMVGSELDQELRQNFPDSSGTRAFHRSLLAATGKAGS